VPVQFIGKGLGVRAQDAKMSLIDLFQVAFVFGRITCPLKIVGLSVSYVSRRPKSGWLPLL
jgi:hypothetical protein